MRSRKLTGWLAVSLVFDDDDYEEIVGQALATAFAILVSDINKKKDD